ncbi:MAG: ATP-binding protein [Lewinella sp.]|nr:ATP-binding protein [Lewinella sp.]
MFRTRKALNDLIQWANQSDRKPLIIRGARQVGKSTLVRMLAKEHYSHYIELNAEKPDIQDLFERFPRLNDFLQAIFLRNNIQTTPDQCLIFIDEIQESPAAIRLLRYFYEEAPEVPVIAAGSLLDFVLGEIESFPVGRVSYYYLNPLDFEEFLLWQGQDLAVEAVRTIPTPEYAYETLFSWYHTYVLLGGMPEIVARYAESSNIAQLQPLFAGLWQGFMDDVEKYGSSNKQRQVLRHVIRTAPLAIDRIKFEGFGQSSYSSREIGEALRALDLARIIRLIYPTTQTEPPMVSDLKKRPRLQVLDTGLLNYAMGIQEELLAVEDLHQVYRGRIIQHHLTQELQSLFTHKDYKPHFWVREKANTNAEVDLIYAFRQYLIPIEIKSGPEGRLRSLHQFIGRCPHPYAIRFLRNQCSIEQYQTLDGKPYYLMNLPYFLMGQLDRYLPYFLDQVGAKPSPTPPA